MGEAGRADRTRCGPRRPAEPSTRVAGRRPRRCLERGPAAGTSISAMVQAQEGLGRARDTVSRAYQYASSTQSLAIARCHWVSSRIQDGQGYLTDSEPGLDPLSAHLLYP